MIAAAALAASLSAAVLGQAPPPVAAGRIVEIRVHGNVTLSDAQVLAIAAVPPGAAATPALVAAVTRRLRDSGRFDSVDVRTRYPSLAMDRVALILIVHERPGLSASGRPPSPLKRLANRLMFLPILDYEDGYGLTYGARTSTVGLLGAGERLSVPVTWGGTRRVALEAERDWQSGPISRLTGALDLSRRENPHFEAIDRRTGAHVRVERRLARDLVVGGDLARTQVRFAGVDGRFWTGGVDVTLDTRNNPSYPVDAVFFGAGWNTFDAHGRAAVQRYRLDARGYKRLFGQTVLALRAQYDRASGPLPEYEQWLLGGAATIRGVRAGAYAGDERAIGSAEVRVPFSSPLSAARLGATIFYDAGLVTPFGTPLGDGPVHRGAGAGLFLVAPFITLNLDVARELGGGTRVAFSTGFSF
ncbi:MAG TPA: BamA/TamA family outer membrane protein [Vicinamibacterales bacterium]|nr:BamA/TamA family outer membrane protein [Vicinamibacterales bacterium]